MAERPDEAEHWAIGRRTGRVAAMSAVVIPSMLLAIVVLSGWFYVRDVRSKTHQPVVTFPAPGIDTYIHDGALDPHEPAAHAQPDPAVMAAKRDVARDGLPGWHR